METDPFILEVQTAAEQAAQSALTLGGEVSLIERHPLLFWGGVVALVFYFFPD